MIQTVIVLRCELIEICVEESYRMSRGETAEKKSKFLNPFMIARDTGCLNRNTGW
jgi:hypothetical protein